MRKLEDVVDEIRYGSVLTINKEKNYKNNNKYNSCIIMYDGKIFIDVKEVELGNFLEIVPNIKLQLNNGYIYRVKYLSDEAKYQSEIINLVRSGGYKEIEKEETINDFLVVGDSFLDSIIELDTIIAQTSCKSSLIKEKVLSWFNKGEKNYGK